MQVTLRKHYIGKFHRSLKVGDWKIIDNFNLSPSTGKYKISSLSYPMGFKHNTEVSKCDSVSDSVFLDLADFEGIKTESYDENVLIDILGQVVSVGKVDEIVAQNKPNKKLEFQIRDVSNELLSCTLWGVFAEKVFSALKSVKHDQKTVVLIRYAKINNFKSEISITSAFDVSDVIIHPVHVPEVDLFVKSLPSDGLALTIQDSYVNRDIIKTKSVDFFDYPAKTIVDLLNGRDVGQWRILGSIFAIDTDWGWFYFGCPKCNRKIELVKESTSTVKRIQAPTKPKFWCDKYQESITNVEARYKLHIRVMDQTGEIKLMVFENNATNLIRKSSEELLDGQYEEIEDPTIKPDVITNLCGKTFHFLVSVEKANIYGGKDIHKVTKVHLGIDITKEESGLLENTQDDPLTIGSEEQGPLMLTNSCENFSDATNNELSTPSSKCGSADLIDIVDQSSTSKKLCSRVNLENGDDEIGTNVIIENADELKIIKDDAGSLLTAGVVDEIDPLASKTKGLTKVKTKRYKE
uniref:Putative replication protein A1 n=1 Tax=Arabidopsis thaliana TaxID=3702 RepID=Q8S8A3_ARATH|nr:putative replication protein A1 [Arabidopsis thaliana]